MTSEQSLSNLIVSCQNDPKRHFQAVYDLLIDQVFSYIRTRSKSQEDATDLTQEVFIDLYQALPQFKYRSDAEFYGFLYLVCKRKLAKYYGKQKDEYLPGDEFLENLPEQRPSHDDEIDINTALKKLEPETREILILHHWQRHTFKEIAEIIGITESAARVKHHRALSILNTLLTKT